MILEEYLELDAKLYPNKIAVVCKEHSLTYKDLYDNVLLRCDELKNASHHKGQVVSFRSSQSVDFLITYFALHKIGCVAAPLEKDMPDELYEQVSNNLSKHEVPEGTADILYTTGTTGKPKGTIISHKTIIANAENLIEGQGFSHDLAFVVNGPLNHIGSLSKIYPIILLGATLIITDGLKDINGFFEAFDYPYKKYATFLVPASIRILIKFSQEQLCKLCDKIEFLETGAAAISQEDIIKLCHILPKSRLYNTYASTETGIISTYNFNDGKNVAGCLGKPMKHSQIQITDEGLIACKGSTLMTGYIGEPERTAEILHDDTLFTSDMGYLDDDGMLHLSGRENDVINVGGLKVSPTEVENAALSFKNIIDCICIPVDHPITGEALKLLVVESSKDSFKKRDLAQYLKTKLEPYKIPMIYEKVDHIKRTYNGKLDRKYYLNPKP